MDEQLTMFETPEEHPSECCYNCKHFAEYKDPRIFDGYGCYGSCFKGFAKNGSTFIYPVYVPEGVCKKFERLGRKR